MTGGNHVCEMRVYREPRICMRLPISQLAHVKTHQVDIKLFHLTGRTRPVLVHSYSSCLGRPAHLTLLLDPFLATTTTSERNLVVLV